MSIRIVDGIAYVETVSEAFAASDIEGVDDVVIADNVERIKMNKLLKVLSRM